MAVDNLHDASAAEALQRLGCRICLAALRRVESLAKIAAHLFRKTSEILARRPHPGERT
jgi:hypothetical protein